MSDEAGVLDFTGVDLAATASADASVVETRGIGSVCRLRR
jgi:hypothetical protein